MSFKQQLIEMKACQEAIDWVGERTIQQAWKDCHRGDWMLWLLEKVEGWVDEKEIMLLGCWCARRVLKYVPKEETRPLKAIEAKEKWIRGEITREEMVAVYDAAYDAIYDSTYDGATNVANIVWIAMSSIERVTYPSNCASWIVTKVSECKESSIQANYFRTQFTPPKGDLCLSNNN